jgi:NADP-dependent 3-hydroxy acid dehydrogenase YdfG
MGRSLQHSVVVITGASGGIGRATAREFARQGARLLLTARRPLLLSEVASECRELGGEALAVPLDAADEHGMNALARKAVEMFGRLDVWFNNAGIGLVGELEEAPPDAVHRAIEMNLMSCIYGARACLPHFRLQGYGLLINNACLLTEDVPKRMALYVAAKWGVRGLGEALRQDLAGTSIHVCTLLSGPAATGFFVHAANFAGRSFEPPLRLLDPAMVAEAVLRCVEDPRPEVVVRGRSGIPGLSRHQIGPAPGALFEPAPDGGLVPMG